MTKHDPKLAQEALAQAEAEQAEAEQAEAPQADAPGPQVTLIGGVADGRRVPRPAGTSTIVRAGPAQELYILSRAHFTSGQPVDIWHARSLGPGEALARALDAYPRLRAEAA